MIKDESKLKKAEQNEKNLFSSGVVKDTLVPGTWYPCIWQVEVILLTPTMKSRIKIAKSLIDQNYRNCLAGTW